MSTEGGHDRLYASLNPLVMNGTLTPQQADEVYRAVGSAGVEGESGGEIAAGWDRARLLAAVAVLAGGLLGAPYLISAGIVSDAGPAWKTVLGLVGVTLVLAAGAAVLLLLLKGRPWAGWVAGVLGASALAAFAIGIVVLWDHDALFYLTGVIMLLGGAAGFWFLKGQLYTVVAVIGGSVLLAQVFSDTVNGGDEGDVLTIGIGFLVYGLVVGAAGWRFSCRHLVGMLGVSIGLLSMFLVMVVNATALALAAAFSDPSLRQDTDVSSARTDIRVALILGLLMAVVAALAHAYTGYVGFAVLGYTGAAVLPFTAVLATQTAHPVRWAGALGLLGVAALAVALGLQFDRRGPGTPAYAAQPTQPDQPGDSAQNHAGPRQT
jgi:hypothetical protein